LIKQWDETFGVGGPFKKDRLWYYATYATRVSTAPFPEYSRT
jgi:hypothetical protein